MKNTISLDEMGLEPMPTIEMQKTDGGFLVELAIGYTILALDAAMQNPSAVVKGFRKAIGF